MTAYNIKRTLIHVLIGISLAFDFYSLFNFQFFPGWEKWVGSILISMVLAALPAIYWEMKCKDLFGSKFDWLDVGATAVVGVAIGCVVSNYQHDKWYLWIGLNGLSLFLVAVDVLRMWKIKHPKK